MDEIVFREICEQIDIAGNQTVFSDHPKRMTISRKNFQDVSGDLKFSFERLITVCISGNTYRNCLPVGMQQKFFEKLRRIFLNDDLAFKIKTCAESVIFMCV